MHPDLVVVHSPVGGGHKSAAMALAEAARARGLSVEVLDTFEHAPRVLGDAYLSAHLTAQNALPDLYGATFTAANRRDGALEPVRRGIDHVAWAGLVRRVVDLAPRFIVATHHLPLIVLGRARLRGRLAAPLVGVVTDYGTHASWAEKGVDALCVPCERARSDAAEHGFPADRLRLTGIPVRAELDRLPDVVDPAPGEPVRVLITSGGFGVGPVADILGSFAGLPGMHLTVVCGRADGLVRRARAAAARVGVHAEVVGFEPEMPARIGAAHVVVGKAGGLTVSEAMTAGRPMVIVAAVPGNEAFNADHVMVGGGGLVARPADAGKIIAGLRAAGSLARMGRCARGLVLPHAADHVLDVALSLGAEARGATAASTPPPLTPVRSSSRGVRTDRSPRASRAPAPRRPGAR